MRARDSVNRIIGAGLQGAARTAGFRKTGLNFHRRRGEVVHVLNVQLSRYNHGHDGAFYVNVGLAFDRLWILADRPIPERPPEVQCHFRRRLESLTAGVPPSWQVSATTDTEQVGRALAAGVAQLVGQLDRVDAIPPFLALGWLGAGADYGLSARLHYALGGLEAAERYLRLEAAYFAGRRGASFEELARRYRLTRLREPGAR